MVQRLGLTSPAWIKCPSTHNSSRLLGLHCVIPSSWLEYQFGHQCHEVRRRVSIYMSGRRASQSETLPVSDDMRGSKCRFPRGDTISSSCESICYPPCQLSVWGDGPLRRLKGRWEARGTDPYVEGLGPNPFSDASEFADLTENSSTNLLAAAPDGCQYQQLPCTGCDKHHFRAGPSGQARACVPSSLLKHISNAADLFCRMFSCRYVLQNTYSWTSLSHTRCRPR